MCLISIFYEIHSKKIGKTFSMFQQELTNRRKKLVKWQKGKEVKATGHGQGRKRIRHSSSSPFQFLRKLWKGKHFPVLNRQLVCWGRTGGGVRDRSDTVRTQLEKWWNSFFCSFQNQLIFPLKELINNFQWTSQFIYKKPFSLHREDCDKKGFFEKHFMTSFITLYIKNMCHHLEGGQYRICIQLDLG